jgi:hypothetical protein
MNHSPALTAIATLASLTMACTGRPGSSPTVDPAPDIPSVVPTPVVRQLHILPGTFHYQLSQTGEIRSSDDTVSSTTTMYAVLRADVAATSDSSFSIIISADSVQTATQGLIPTPRTSQVIAVDSVIHAVLTPTTITLVSSLPDSLCRYSALATAAYEVLLPALPPVIHVPSASIYTDTTLTTSCPAQIPVRNRTIRQIRSSETDPLQFRITGETEITGAGVIRRDSLLVTGSVSTHGRVSFNTASRLPAVLEATSKGSITVQLGNTHTTFTQISSLTLRQISLALLPP